MLVQGSYNISLHNVDGKVDSICYDCDEAAERINIYNFNESIHSLMHDL